MTKGWSDEKEQLNRDEWVRMRLQTYFLVNIQLERKNQLNNPKKLFKFDWENDDFKPLTNKQFQKLKSYES